MVENSRAPSAAIILAGRVAVLLCLFAPSAWMISTIPPLWRDVDAYIQLTQDPRVTTFWGHGPAYSYVAKVPLFLGELLERWRGLAVDKPHRGVSALTDTGVALLILGQHLALTAAVFYFIAGVSRLLWVRLLLAVLWASNALFYTFAHCVGSESLSVIVTLLAAAQGFRLVTARGEPVWRDWFLFAVALWICLLTRHVNLLLILSLPMAFALVALWPALSHGRRVPAVPLSRSASNPRRTGLQHLVVALAIGVSCVLLAGSATQSLARKTRLHPHSRMGHTFLARLQFLEDLPPAGRAALLQRVSERSKSPQARTLVVLLEQMHEEGAHVDVDSFRNRAIAKLYPGETNVPWEQLDRALNEMAAAFLSPPVAELATAARKDLATALAMPATEIGDHLFATTAYFFQHRETMPGCATLATFRNSKAEAITRLPTEHRYFHLWGGVNAKAALVCWFVLLAACVGAAWRRRENLSASASFAVALTLTGVLITIANCLLTELLSRFVAPLWLFLLLSLQILVASILGLASSRRSAQAGS
jgi:hypothetical protein